jgi:nitrate reductase (NAD(P)H)
MQDRKDSTTCVILACNRAEEDILCRESLDALFSEGRGKGKIIYTLTNGDEKWNGLRGRINGQLVNEHCPYCPDTLVLACGPEGMENIVRVLLEENGWKKEQIVFF